MGVWGARVHPDPNPKKVCNNVKNVCLTTVPSNCILLLMLIILYMVCLVAVRRNPMSDAAFQKEIVQCLQFNTIAALQLCVE